MGYYDRYLEANFWWAPLFVLGWLYAVARLLLAPNFRIALLLYSALLFTPVLFYLGTQDDRLGQTILFLDLSLIATALMLTDGVALLAAWLAPQISNQKSLLRSDNANRLTAIVLAVATFGVWADRGFRAHLGAAKRLLTGSEFVVAGRHSPASFEAGSWLAGEFDAGQPVLVDEPVWEVFDFVTDLRFLREKLPATSVTFNLALASPNRPVKPDDRIVGIWPALGLVGGSSRYRNVDILLERDQTALQHALGGRPLFLSKRNNFLAYFLYPGVAPSFSNTSIEIYTGAAPANRSAVADFVASDTFAEVLPWLRTEHPDELTTLEHFLRAHQLELGDLLAHSYSAHIRGQLQDSLPQNARIAYLGDFESVAPKEWWPESRAVEGNPTHDELAAWADYLVVQDSPSIAPPPGLLAWLSAESPRATFATVTYFGEGWRLYEVR